MRWITGAASGAASELSAFAADLRLDDIHRTQCGGVEDMDLVADALLANT